MKEPVLIQGGMGVAVSNWKLAKAVSREGQLGVVSGTMIDTVLVRRLQDGDPDGDIRRALLQFPDQSMTKKVLDKYFISGGKKKDKSYKNVPMHKINLDRDLAELIIIANFVEVYLAKENHSGLVGINYLEKIQLPTLPSIYGALLAGVDYILMGAGIPRSIPGIIDSLVDRQKAMLKLDVKNLKSGESYFSIFDPLEFPTLESVKLKRPKFLAIISSNLLAKVLTTKSNGKVDGFVIENYLAGGHNAPPRGGIKLDDEGEPIYGERDEVDLDAIKKLNVPFWLAGTFGNDGKLKEALKLGASGIQTGTPFAFCEESGFAATIKEEIIEKTINNELEIRTDLRASASNYPFKVVQLDTSLSCPDNYEERNRVCDLGYLRTTFKNDDGSIGYRCPGEPVEQFVRKGGAESDTVGRKCLCNGLLSAIDLPQVQSTGDCEKPLVTAGKSINEISRFLKDGKDSYSAKDVVHTIIEQLDNRH